MAERIYTSTAQGKLESLEETPFSSEDELQALIAEHPELLDGEQIRPGNARRWLLITREKGIASSSGEGARWAVDHLIVDQDAVPTLVEVKRGRNSEIRRAIVGQMLDYAANASETWTADDLRNAFVKQVGDRGLDPADELAVLLGDEEPDVEGFWEDVSTNLAARRLRLLFIADKIPDELARVVALLNAQMPSIEVLAVEIKRFHGESSETLVPRVIGRISAGTSGGRGSSARITRDSFLEGFASEEVGGVADRLLGLVRKPNSYVHYGTSGVSIRATCSAWKRHISLAWLWPQPNTVMWQSTRDFSFGAAILDEELPEKLRTVLEGWVNQFSADSFTEDVSSKGVKAWAVSHETAVDQQELLVNRLSNILSKLASL